MCEKCEEAKAIIEEWQSQQGHDRCWYYPEVFRKLATLFGVKPVDRPDQLSRRDFEKGCERFQDEIFL